MIAGQPEHAADGGGRERTPALRMRAITMRFPGVVANRNVDLDVYPGEIHGLLGENGAGKTTLMNVLYGLLQPDEGSIEIDGRHVRIHSPRDAAALGIGMVHQHFKLVPDMTVAENIALGLRSSRPPLSNIRAVVSRVKELSGRYGLRVDPDDLVEDLSVGMQQRVEILKLLYRNARILVLDEPTSVLTPSEWDELSAVLRSLVSEGRSAIFITHKLDEMLSVAERCTVLRDGEVVGTVGVASTDKPTLARLMVGRDVVLRVQREFRPPGSPVLEAEGVSLTSTDGRQILADISFQVREGEILGVAGVDGNGQQELVEVLTGVRPATAGRISIGGSAVRHLDPRSFVVRYGGAVIPGDRQQVGLVLDLALSDNLMLRDFDREPYCRHGVLDASRIREHCTDLIGEYQIRTTGQGVRVRQLSGGNQQRAVLARELHRAPRFLIAANPTRGLDVGAMEFVYQRLIDHANGGGATLLISSELDEIVSLSDRVAVIYRGAFQRILEREEIDPEVIGLLMAGERVDR
jgi:simple sugar transport system ATP-binding protein